jgi:hypothetical protein
MRGSGADWLEDDVEFGYGPEPSAEHRQVQVVRPEHVKDGRGQVEERLDVEKIQWPVTLLEDPLADLELFVSKRLQAPRPLQVFRPGRTELAGLGRGKRK